MNKFIARLTVVFTLLMLAPILTSPTWADFEDGVAAYQRGDYATALREYRPLANQGHAEAQWNLGLMYLKGEGVPRNQTEGMRLLRALGDRYAMAQYEIGRIYYNGSLATQNYAEAARWLLKAAKQGHAEAQFSLGTMYLDGHGVPQSWLEAHKWYNISASNGYSRAPKARDIAAKRMTPAQIAEAQRLAQEWQANHE